MEVPEVVKRIGKIDGKRKIYIEDYVLSYLERFKFEETEGNERIILYGKRERNFSEEICVIYGAEKKNPREIVQKESIFSVYEEVGCLNTDMWKCTQGMCEGILIGDGNGGQPIEGYYIFYEKEPIMGKYLGLTYEEEIKRVPYARQSEKKEEEAKAASAQAELVALSQTEVLPESPVYDIIRAVVICIFIIICAMAITTVNNFEKMEDFKEAAVEMNEALEEP